jgi:hypothetical protein
MGPRVRQARAHATEQVTGGAVLERPRCRARPVAARAADRADRDQIDRGLAQTGRLLSQVNVVELTAARGKKAMKTR